MLGRFIFLVLITCPALFCNEVTFNGTFYGQKTIDRYCIKPLEDTSFEMELQSNRTNCLTFLDYSGEIGKDCDTDSYLYVDNLKEDVTYYVIEARLRSSTRTTNYTLWVNAAGEIEAGICPSYQIAKATGMNGEQLSFLMGLSGLFIAIMFFGSITYIILHIKEY